MIRAAALFAALALAAAPPVARIVIDYPEQDTIFPPDLAPPTLLWRDTAGSAKTWRIEVTFADGSPGIRAESPGEPFSIGAVDPRAVAETNELPKLSPEQAAARTWKPEAGTWEQIKRRSQRRPATLTITGYADGDASRPVSRGSVTIHTSKDPVGAPIFYRDVPLMPSELEKGVIKPLAAAAVPLIAWRLRSVSESRSRLLMEGLHTCANCHSFSRDGKTMGMDLDGPQNDKGLYTIVPVAPEMTIRNEDVVKWSSFRGDSLPDLRVGFMSQVSPQGDYVVTMIDRPAAGMSASRARAGRSHFYVANFKDYRFLQVFYPTRGILAWYSRATGRLQPLPGADDPRYVHTDAVWSPDGAYLVFARAPAREPYAEGRKMAESANDPNETQIQYDLYRIPFNEGRGGVATPIAGASGNGMSNSFPKVSPDGRWIVFVQCRNGQLMRPDSRLFLVPAKGGPARKLRANLPRMNSWHSFSPNGRWLVFSSKSRSPYTQMYLTHIDGHGNDSPAVLIENATEANRAVNIPEFVNIPYDGMRKIDTPAVESYRLFDRAVELMKKGQYEAAAAEWKNVLALAADDAKVHMNFGVALAGAGRSDQAVEQYRKALEIEPGYPEAHNNLGLALARDGKTEEAIGHYRKALDADPHSAVIHNNLGAALARSGNPGEAAAHFQKSLELSPDSVEVHGNLIRALAQAGRSAETVDRFESILRLHPNSAAVHNTLGLVLISQQGKTGEALAHWREALRAAPDHLPALNQAAFVLATDADPSVRNGAEAVQMAERAVRLSGAREPAILDTLAAAYAEAGRFPQAIETARRALSIASEQGRQPLAEALKARIALYEAGTPYGRSP